MLILDAFGQNQREHAGKSQGWTISLAPYVGQVGREEGPDDWCLVDMRPCEDQAS